MTIGLDIAKSVFQVHGVDASGEAVLKRQLKRAQMTKFFAELPPSLNCNRGLWYCAPFSPTAGGAAPRGEADPTCLCEALREATEERRSGCRGDLRGGHAAIDALCDEQVGRPASPRVRTMSA